MPFARIWITLLLTLLLPLSWAAAASSAFERGLAAFEAGRYAEAVDAFRTAQRQGERSAALRYNLGVSYYRLQRYGEAQASFKSLLNHATMAAAAAYNLGLIENARGNERGAVPWFRRALRLADDANMRRLSRKALVSLGATPPSTSRGGESVSELGLAYGSDSNIVDPTSTATDSSDSYLELFASYAHISRSGASFNALYLSQDYAEVNNYDLSFIALRGSWPLRQRGWQLSLGPLLTQSQLGGLDYEQHLGAELSSQHPLSGGAQLRTRLRLSQISSGDRPALEGDQQRLRLEYRFGGTDQRLYYEWEQNNRTDTTTASFSPTRHSIKYRLDVALTRAWTARASLRYRDSQYPSLSGSARSDQLASLELQARLALSRALALKLIYKLSDNRSNLTQYDYQRNNVRAGIALRF